MTELKMNEEDGLCLPCANCGSKKHLLVHDEYWYWWKIYCDVCLMQTPEMDTKEEVLAIWNRRPLKGDEND
jgi:hypothetical protein